MILGRQFDFGEEQPVSDETLRSDTALHHRGLELLRASAGRAAVRLALSKHAQVRRASMANRQSVAARRNLAKDLLPKGSDLGDWERESNKTGDANLKNALGNRAILTPQVPGALPHQRSSRER